MRNALLTAIAAVSLLAACREQARDEAATNAAAGNAAAGAAGAAANSSTAPPLGAPVAGEQAKTVMKERHDGMEDIGDAMKLVSRELKSDSPDLARVRDGAATIARLAPEVSGWFPPGTGPDVGKTDAKPEIWQKPEDFTAKRDTFQKAAQEFNAAAQGSDLAAIRAAHGDLGKSCKACHDLYREKDKD